MPTERRGASRESLVRKPLTKLKPSWHKAYCRNDVRKRSTKIETLAETSLSDEPNTHAGLFELRTIEALDRFCSSSRSRDFGAVIVPREAKVADVSRQAAKAARETCRPTSLSR